MATVTRVGQALFFCSPDPLEDDVEPLEERDASFVPPELSDPFDDPEDVEVSDPLSDPLEELPSLPDPVASFPPSEESLDDPPDRFEAA